MEAKFSDIYLKKKWGSRPTGEGSSGSGSNGVTPDTKFHIAELMRHIHETGSKYICDVGCGDWEFSKTIDWTGLDYTGIDIVESVIKNNRQYEKENIKFQHGDAGQIPMGYDFVILKDVIQHWTDKQIEDILPDIVKQNRYVYLVNGYKFGRDKTKNNWTVRELDKVYHYHPVDVFKEPIFGLSLDVISIEHRRCKEFVLIRNKNLVKDKDGKYYDKDGGTTD